ncbi:MAG: ABC transporter permease [Chloroflexota bacterium]
MNKTLLILRHEFITTIKRKGFLILTLLFPLIGFTAIGIHQLTQGARPPSPADATVVGYVDEFGGFDNHASEVKHITLTPYETRDEATKALLAEDIEEYFVVPADYLKNGLILRYHTQKELEIRGDTSQAMRLFLQSNLLGGQTTPEIAERVKNPISISSIRLDETGGVASDQGGFAAFFVPMVFGFLLIMAIGSSSGYLIQGLGEEKENRIMEVLLSSVSTTQLLIGKVLGLGAAGLVQIIVWLLSIVFLVGLAGSAVGGMFATVQIPDNILVLGIVYFVLGYLFFAVLQAGAGAMGANARESSQWSVAFILPAILPFYVATIFLRDHPDHVVGTVLTLIPITAPMSVFVRMGMSEIPAWELAVSICLLVLGIVGGLLLAAKMFRVFLLMYGKAPRLGQVLRLLRQA